EGNRVSSRSMASKRSASIRALLGAPVSDQFSSLNGQQHSRAVVIGGVGEDRAQAETGEGPADGATKGGGREGGERFRVHDSAPSGKGHPLGGAQCTQPQPVGRHGRAPPRALPLGSSPSPTPATTHRRASSP